MKFATILFALCLCSSCTSYHWLLRPGATGSVVDSQTGSPIAGAQVTLSRDPKFYANWYFDENRGLRVTNIVSGADGSFSFPPLEKWGHIDTTSPNDVVFYVLSVRHDGYQSFTNAFYYLSGDYPSGRCQGAPALEFTTNFDKIHLERLER